MQKSFILTYKFIQIYSDGCLQLSNKFLNFLKHDKKLILYKKDYKSLQKISSSNNLLINKTNYYKKKIF